MKEYFQQLFMFNHWANDQVVSCLMENQIDDEKVIRIVSHILLAQENWYKRATKQQRDVTVWTVLQRTEIVSRLSNSDEKWIDFMKNLNEEDFNEILSYQNLAGDPQQSTFQDVLAHVINHATYHRGQVIYLIRDSGIAPPTTDYIKFARM